MRLRAAQRDLPFFADLAIAAGLVFSATFFLIVMEFCLGHGELTRAQLSLLDANRQVAHASPTNRNQSN